jgi:hypothetical protein
MVFFFGFVVEHVIGQVIGVEVGFDGLDICLASRDDSGFVSSTTELKVLSLSLMLRPTVSRPVCLGI